MSSYFTKFLIFKYFQFRLEEGEVTLTDVESFESGEEYFIEDVTSERYVRKQVITI